MSEEKKTNNSSVIRVIKNKNYTVMSNKHLFCRELSLKAKGLMSLCIALPDYWEYSVAGLMSLSNDGRDSVTSAIKALEKLGFLTIKKERTEQGTFCSIYSFYENPDENPNYNSDSTVTDFPTRGNNHDGKTESDNPMQLNRCGSTEAENHELLNTNELNIKNNNTKTKKTNKKKENKKNIFGEFQNVSLSEAEETKLKDLYKSKFNEAIEKLSSYKYASGKKYKSDYAVLNKHNWVYKSIFPNGDNVREFPTQPRNEGKYSNCYQ